MSTESHLPPDPGTFVTPKPKVVKFEHPAQAGVVELLEDWLEQARVGDVRGVVLVAIYQDGSSEVDFDGLANSLQALGALEYAKAELIDAMRPEEE